MTTPAHPSFDAERARAWLRERALSLGEPLFALTKTSSTNDDALNAAKAGAAHGATFVAEEQTAGRGRRGHRWSSAPGENLTFSVVLRPHIPPERAGAFTLAVGLAVREVAAARVAAPLTLKWPNDVLHGKQKLAGILVESVLHGGGVSALVVGIGLNVHMQNPPVELADSATSLALLGARDLQREALLCDLLDALATRLAQYEASGLAPFLPELAAHDALAGVRIRIDSSAGIARGIDASGALLLEIAPGDIRQIVSGTVERLP